jgi:serine/threonine protein kinase/tetratricopeptide (TPR) repeat protein
MAQTLRARAKHIFGEAVALTEEARGTLLNERCGSDAALRHEVEQLLRAHDEAGAFLDRPTLLPRDLASSAGDAEEEAGTHIGPYRLLQKLGEGGFGAVFMAEQDRPVHRRVALKLIKRGMDSRQVVARFEAERQALALMDHPNIARIFDAGSTPAGRPYFVMELVRGRPITRFCDEHRLPLRNRLALFADLCDAVQHAHQKGVIHRDLKPGNILVSLSDEGGGRPIAKIIDFGIAKAIGTRLTERTLFTEHGALIGTPEYMSPEQAEFDALDIDTRADVYALGVLLYELLTGTTPIEGSRLRSASPAEVQRIIRDTDPPRPSTRLASATATDPGRTRDLAVARRATPAELRGQLRGELDWVVMKALEKDRRRRYQSAAELAADVRRFLDHRPVLAGPQSTAYQIRTFMRRNRLATIVTACIAAGLLAGGAGITMGLIEARRANVQERILRAQAQSSEQAAVDALTRARVVADFLKSVFSAVSPAAAQGRDTTLLREILDAGAARAATDLADQPQALGEILVSIGQAYTNVALYEPALPLLTRAHDLLAGTDPNTRGRAAQALGTCRVRTNRYADAIDVLEPAIVLLRHDPEHDPRLLGDLLQTRAEASLRAGRPEEAEPFLNEALRVYRPSHDVAQRAGAMLLLASVRRAAGAYDDARSLLEQAIESLRPLPDQVLLLGNALNSLAVLERTRNNPARAVELYRESLAVKRPLFDRPHPDVAGTLVNLGNALVAQGKYDEAEPILREAVDLHHQIYKGEHANEAIAIDRLGILLLNRGELAEAEAQFRRAGEIMQRTLPPNHPFHATLQFNLATVVREQGQLARAEALYREALHVFENNAREAQSRILTRTSLGDVIALQGRLEEGLDMIEKGLQEARTLGFSPMIVIQGQISAARILRQLGRATEAADRLDALLATVESGSPLRPTEFSSLLRECGQAHAAAGRHERGIALLIRAFDHAAADTTPRGQDASARICEALAHAYTSWHDIDPRPEHAQAARLWAQRASLARAGAGQGSP